MPPRPRSAFERVKVRIGTLPSNQCWIWPGAVFSNGYGHVSGPGREGRSLLVHVVTYEALVGPVPDGLVLDHTCRDRRCCNPAHLEPVSNAVNTQRGAATKLRPMQVLEILVRARRGVPQKRLAADYRIRAATVSQIVAGKRWANIHQLKGSF